MSYIDGYKHELVGMLGRLPVYRPLENIPEPIDEPNCEDFGCTPQQLVMGGGSGEHPGLVLLEPAGAVAAFVLSSGDFALEQFQQEKLEELVNPWKHLHFAGWSTEDHHRFYEMCTCQTLPNPFDDEGNLELIQWLYLGFGEFIFFAMPNLAEKVVDSVKPRHTSAHWMRYNNILLVPPGIPLVTNGGNAFFPSDC
jgi:hypothetical protein